MSNSQKGFYDNYWIKEGNTHSGARAGYARNFCLWMAENLKGLSKTDPILEVGCGDASFTKELSHFSANVSAIDISSEQITVNQKNHLGINFLAHDLSAPLPFATNHFQAIWCSEVLEHLFDPAFALTEMYRVLKPEGVVLLTVPYHGLVKNVFIALFKWDHHFDPEYPHIRFFTKNTLSRLCVKAGFKETHMITCGMDKPWRDFLIPTNLLLRAKKP
jgi:SAM-dependent methyltransferase